MLDPVEIVPLIDEVDPRLHLPEIGGDPVPLLRHRCVGTACSTGASRSSREARDRLAAELAIIEKKRLSGYASSRSPGSPT